MRRNRRFAAAVAALAALSLAAPAGALHLPLTFGIAHRGTLEVSSSVVVGHRDVDMRGGWNNTALSCRQWRSLDVRIEIDYAPPAGGLRVIRDRRIRPVQNCAEGGPNMGFTIAARRFRLACPDGTWKPGRYGLTTRTLHRASGLRAIGALDWTKRGRC